MSPKKPKRNSLKLRYDKPNQKLELIAEGIIAVVGSLMVLAAVIVFHKYL